MHIFYYVYIYHGDEIYVRISCESEEEADKILSNTKVKSSGDRGVSVQKDIYISDPPPLSDEDLKELGLL